MFDLWKRGMNPFDTLRQQVADMPNTPTSMLFRSTAINAMSNLPHDAIDAFIQNSVQCGMNVFTNFDAHNDPRNHKQVAEGVLKHGGHYQAALSWAVFNSDPSIYNVQWAVDFFRECVAMGAHSLYIKDPSGVLTPEMAACVSRQVKEAYPHLPLVIHTHYQTGYGYMTYLEAVKNGANGVECSLGFPDGAGQPYGLTMLRAFEDLGFNTGDPDKKAMTEVSDFCKEMRPLYPQANLMRSPDISVENSGIAGGQRSILDKELINLNIAYLIPQIDIEVANVRAEGGKVCQVTPVADTYAREAMRRLRGGSPDQDFVPGYTGILVGEGGLVKEPVDSVKQRRALFERAQQLAMELVGRGDITGVAATEVANAGSPMLKNLVETMLTLAQPTVRSQRIDEVDSRIRQLQVICEDPALLTSLDRKFARYVKENSVEGDELCSNTADKLVELQAELQTLHSQLDGDSAADAVGLPVLTQPEYEKLLRGSGDSPHLAGLMESSEHAKRYIEAGLMSTDTFAKLLGRAGFITCPQTDLLAPAMSIAREAIERIEQQEVLGLCETPQLKEDLSVLYACYNRAAIPDMYINFLRNYREDFNFWPALFTGQTRSGMIKMPRADSGKFKKTQAHKEVEKQIGGEMLGQMISMQKSIHALEDRVYSQTHSSDLLDAEEISEPHAFKRRLAPATVEKLQTNLAELQVTLSGRKISTGVSDHYRVLIDDLIQNAIDTGY